MVPQKDVWRLLSDFARGILHVNLEVSLVSLILEVAEMLKPRADPGVDRSPQKKPTNVTLFTMIFYNSENSVRDLRPFCRPLFCHSSVLKYTWSLLQQRSRYETWLPNITEFSP